MTPPAVEFRPTIGEIAEMLSDRRGGMGRILQAMRDVCDTYNADIAVPLPELESDESAAIANLLRQGLDGNSQRISSTMPDAVFPVLRPEVKRDRDDAKKRRRAVLGWWEMNDMELVMGQRARYLTGYASSPVVIRPETRVASERAIPRWEARVPMASFPSAPARSNDMLPGNIIFTFTRTYGWLCDNYPAETSMLPKRAGCDRNTTFECVEYIDDNVIVLGVLGHADASSTAPLTGSQAGAWRDTRGGAGGPQRFAVTSTGTAGGTQAVELERSRNWAGRCTAVAPGRITLDRPLGQYDGMIPKYKRAARLDALELIAIEEGIFPKQWLVARPNEQPKVIRMANGRKGQMGVVSGGVIDTQNLNPGYKTTEAIDRLQEAERQEGGVGASMTGQAPTNVRTGRQSDTILSAQIDFMIQEHQRILAKSMRYEDDIAIDVMKGYFGRTKSSFYIDWRGARGPIEFVPDELFPEGSNRHTVRYSMAGTDLNQQIVRNGQKIGLGLISKQTGRENDPEIQDPEAEHDRVTFEALEGGILAEFSQPGSFALPDKAKVMQMILSDRVELAEAVIQVHEEAQRRQATSGAPGTPEAPAAPGSPETQPGIAPPGTGAEAGTIAPPGPSLDALNQILGQASRSRQAMRAPAVG